VNLEVVSADVWVPCDHGNELARIPVGSAQATETIPMDANPAVVAGAEGDVWVSQFDAGQVWRLHPG
jgi:hypothetical protein